MLHNTKTLAKTIVKYSQHKAAANVMDKRDNTVKIGEHGWQYRFRHATANTDDIKQHLALRLT